MISRIHWGWIIVRISVRVVVVFALLMSGVTSYRIVARLAEYTDSKASDVLAKPSAETGMLAQETSLLVMCASSSSEECAALLT